MPYLVLLAALAFAISPLFVPGFGGFEAGQFPIPQDDPPVQPAGYAFGIWGLIYAWLVIGAAYGLWRKRQDPEWAPMRLPLIVSLGIGAIWLPVAVTSAIWATILIWAMWGFAIWALLRSPGTDTADKWLGRAPVALYAGWLTAASCVSLGLMGAGYGWLNAVPAALLALVLALALAVIVARQRPDAPAFLIGVIWALIGVIAANAQGGSTAVLALGAAGAALLLIQGALHLRSRA